jgi:hypothetical protein
MRAVTMLLHISVMNENKHIYRILDGNSHFTGWEGDGVVWWIQLARPSGWMMCRLQSWHTWRCLGTVHIRTPMSSCATQCTRTACCRLSGSSRRCHSRPLSRVPCQWSRRTVLGCSQRGQWCSLYGSVTMPVLCLYTDHWYQLSGYEMCFSIDVPGSSLKETPAHPPALPPKRSRTSSVKSTASLPPLSPPLASRPQQEEHHLPADVDINQTRYELPVNCCQIFQPWHVFDLLVVFSLV